MLRDYQIAAIKKFQAEHDEKFTIASGAGKAIFHTLYTIRLGDREYETTDLVEAWTFCLQTGAYVMEEKEVNYEAKLFSIC